MMQFFPLNRKNVILFAETLANVLHRLPPQEENAYYATAIDNLGTLVREGDTSKTNSLFEKAFIIRQKVLGEAHSDYAKSLLNMSDVYRWRGDNKQALSLLLQALTIIKNSLGEENALYAQCLSNLGYFYFNSIHEREKGISLREQELAIRKKILGEDNPMYALYLCQIAFYYDQLSLFAWQ
ncbi:MAG: tetratricopeptide repeat protein [Parafilimonas sp.]